jgi:hypothetical protein
MSDPVSEGQKPTVLNNNQLREYFEDWLLEGSGDCHWYQRAQKLLDTISVFKHQLALAREALEQIARYDPTKPPRRKIAQQTLAKLEKENK